MSVEECSEEGYEHNYSTLTSRTPTIFLAFCAPRRIISGTNVCSPPPNASSCFMMLRVSGFAPLEEKSRSSMSVSTIEDQERSRMHKEK
ncbi:hypothetical protein RB195_005252 [Necator americanus]|uniref:Uncharacterized protein n=1 Tax=Necator americanus TaxID=51031 RepID=A0ABR1BLY2_NECAM